MCPYHHLFAFPYVHVPKTSTGVGICSENVFQVLNDSAGPGKVLKQVISSLRQAVLMPSLLWWGEEQQEELLAGFGQRVFRWLPSSQPSMGKECAKCQGCGCLFKSLAQPQVIHLSTGIVEQEDVRAEDQHHSLRF